VRKGYGALAALVLVCATLLSGCAAPGPIPQPTATPNLPLPESQQILRPLAVGVNSALNDRGTLEPAWIVFPADQQIDQLIFPHLVTLDERGLPVGWAAESHAVSANGLTYVFHLRTAMTWSDGSPIDAQTFAYSINRALDPCTGSGAAYYLYPIKGAQAVNTCACLGSAVKSATSLIGSSLLVPDTLTLQIIFQQLAGYFLTALANPIAWGVPRALIERHGVTRTDDHPAWTEHLADSGGFGGNLYRLVRWDHNGHLEL
jgi:oligopeptide transport system substrate-binding protein